MVSTISWPINSSRSSNASRSASTTGRCSAIIWRTSLRARSRMASMRASPSSVALTLATMFAPTVCRAS
jgi:hypothetical protein